MSKLLYSTTMSLDGFIAGPGGDMSWLTEHLADNPPVRELIGTIGALLIGRRTYDGDDPHRGDPEREGKAFGGGWDGPHFVVTHRPPAAASAEVTFVTDLPDAIAMARAAAGDRYVNVLGADIARQCLTAGELDEILAIVAPVMLGDGTRLFDVAGGEHVALRGRGVDDLVGVTNLWFEVVRP